MDQQWTKQQLICLLNFTCQQQFWSHSRFDSQIQSGRSRRLPWGLSLKCLKHSRVNKLVCFLIVWIYAPLKCSSHYESWVITYPWASDFRIVRILVLRPLLFWFCAVKLHICIIFTNNVLGGGFESRRDILIAMYRLQMIALTVILIWILAHIGIKGNETADRCAKEATQKDRSEICDFC